MCDQAHESHVPKGPSESKFAPTASAPNTTPQIPPAPLPHGLCAFGISRCSSSVFWCDHRSSVPEHDRSERTLLRNNAPAQSPDVLNICRFCIPRSFQMIVDSEQSEISIEPEAGRSDFRARVAVVGEADLAGRVGDIKCLGGPGDIASRGSSPDTGRGCSHYAVSVSEKTISCVEVLTVDCCDLSSGCQGRAVANIGKSYTLLGKREDTR